MTAPKKIVLAYSGGLDTSVILPWLKGRYPGVKLVAFAAELGQGDELKGIEKKAYKSGADEVVVKDLRKEFAEDYCFPMLRAHATYEDDYLLGTSIARPLIAKHQVLVAHQTGADAVGHGATGKGNDQVRFELTYMALDPTLKIISPWKDPQFLADGLNDRETAIDYAEKHRIPITASKKKIYSQDRNLWHISHEGAEIEDPAEEPKEAVYTISVPPAQAPNKAEYVEVEFKAGIPVAVERHQLPRPRPRADRRAEPHRRQARRRPGDAGREPPRRHEEPRRLRDAGRHDPLRGAQGARAALPRARPLSLQAAGGAEVRRAGLLRAVVPPAARGAADVHGSRQPGRDRQGEGEAVQGPRRGDEREVAALALRHQAGQLRDEGLRRHGGARLHRSVRAADEGARPKQGDTVVGSGRGATKKAAGRGGKRR